MANMGKFDIVRLGMPPLIWRDKSLEFWSNWSDVICKNIHF